MHIRISHSTKNISTKLVWQIFTKSKYRIINYQYLIFDTRIERKKSLEQLRDKERSDTDLMRAHHHHHYNPSKNVPSSNNRLSFPSNPRNPLPLSLNINFIYTCISSDALKFRYTFLHHTQRPIERKKERARWMSRGKVRQEEEGKKNPPRFVAMPSPSSFLHPRKRCSIKDNGNWKDNRTSSPCGSLSLPNAHTFAHTRETHRIEIQSGCRISDAFVVHVVGRRRRHNFRFVDENSNAEFPARFHDPTRSTQPPHHSWRTRKSPDQLSSCRGIAIDLPSSRSTVKNRFFFRKRSFKYRNACSRFVKRIFFF